MCVGGLVAMCRCFSNLIFSFLQMQKSTARLDCSHSSTVFNIFRKQPCTQVVRSFESKTAENHIWVARNALTTPKTLDYGVGGCARPIRIHRCDMCHTWMPFTIIGAYRSLTRIKRVRCDYCCIQNRELWFDLDFICFCWSPYRESTNFRSKCLGKFRLVWYARRVPRIGGHTVAV